MGQANHNALWKGLLALVATLGIGYRAYKGDVHLSTGVEVMLAVIAVLGIINIILFAKSLASK